MLAILCWFARVGERMAATWRQLRERFSRWRRDDAKVPSARVDDARELQGGLARNRHVVTSVRVTEVFVTRRRVHAGRPS